MPMAAKSDADAFGIPERPSLVSSDRPKRGRPTTLSDEKKRKRRNVSISDEAWDRLEKLAADLGCSSKSELLEKIGKGDLDLSKQEGLASSSALSDILIYRRILGLFSPHGDVLRSFVGFNYAVCQKLPALRGKLFSEVIVDNMLTSMTVIFQHCYIRPDRYINSISALNRLLGYCLLLNQAGLGDAWEPELDGMQADENFIDNEGAKACLGQIQRAMRHLKAASFSHQLTALRLKYIGGFTEAQIQQIYELQGMSFSIEQLRSLVHEGWASFRNHWSQSNEMVEPEDLSDVPVEAKTYCYLLWSSSLESPKDRKDLLKILLKATYDAPLNFWLCEIEYKWGTEFLGKDAGLDRELEQLKSEIQGLVDKRFRKRKQAIDKDMHYCIDRNAAVKKLANLFEEETQINRNTQLGAFMIQLLQAEAEERFALKLTKGLKYASFKEKN